MRRWVLIGFAAMTVGLIGWVTTELRAGEEEGQSARHEEAPATDERRVRPVGEGPQPEPHRAVREPAAPPDTRDATQRVDDVIAELQDKHDELVAAGAVEAAKTVQAQIDRLEAEQQKRSANGE
jgi:hypothetical protein